MHLKLINNIHTGVHFGTVWESSDEIEADIHRARNLSVRILRCRRNVHVHAIGGEAHHACQARRSTTGALRWLVICV